MKLIGIVLCCVFGVAFLYIIVLFPEETITGFLAFILVLREIYTEESISKSLYRWVKKLNIKNLFILTVLFVNLSHSTAQEHRGVYMSQRFYTEMTPDKNVDVRIEAGYLFDYAELSSNYKIFSIDCREEIGFKFNRKLIGRETCLFAGVEKYIILHNKGLHLSPTALSLQIRRYTQGPFSFSFTVEFFKKDNIRNINYFSLSYHMF